MSEIKTTINKLFAQAESEMKIGNAGAAKLYREKAESLMGTNKLTKKQLSEPVVYHVQGSWKCSCGAVISLDLQGANDFTARLANIMLAPHHAHGHRLEKIG
jgi:hypothetical protein